MKLTKKALITAGATLALTGGGAAALTASADATGTYQRCPAGAVCIYPGPDYSGTPTAYFSYGAHDLYNQYGNHRILNNQTGGAIMRTCTGSNGKGCQGVLGANQYMNKDLGPINSIVLARK